MIIQWHNTKHKSIININDKTLVWDKQVKLNSLNFSRGSRGLIVTLESGECFLIDEGKVYIAGCIISVANIEGDIYIHVAWSDRGKQYESTTGANHWYAIWLSPYQKIKRKHIAKMNKFVRYKVGRNNAETWVAK